MPDLRILLFLRTGRGVEWRAGVVLFVRPPLPVAAGRGSESEHPWMAVSIVARGSRAMRRTITY